MYYSFIAVLLGTLFLSGCSREDYSGVYRFKDGKTDETVHLKPDGSYTQELIIGYVTNTADGRWFIKNGDITLEGFLVRYDTVNRRSLSRPEKFGHYYGWWDSGKRRLFFDADNEGRYFLNKD